MLKVIERRRGGGGRVSKTAGKILLYFSGSLDFGLCSWTMSCLQKFPDEMNVCIKLQCEDGKLKFMILYIHFNITSNL